MPITYNGTPDDLLTYTSPSPKLTLQRDGFYSYQPHNICLQSENLATGWSIDNGSVTATVFTENTVSGRHSAQYPSLAITSGASYRVAARLTYIDRQYASVSLSNAASADMYFAARFDLIAGTVSSTQNGGTAGGTITASSITAVSAGVWDVYIEGTLAATSTNLVLSPALDGTTWTTSSRGAQNFLGTSASVGFTRVQLYRTPAPSTYLQTTTAARYNLPYEWDSSGTPLGIRVEPAATNLSTNSTDINNASWIKSGCTVSPNVKASIISGLSADLLIPNAASGTFKEVQAPITTTSGTNYCASFIVEAQNYRYVQIIGASGGFGTFYVNWDLVTGTETAFSAGTSTVVARNIENLGNGVYRVWAAVTSIFTGSTRMSLNVIPDATAVRGATWSSDGTSGVYVHHGQLETGSVATSPIETYASTVTRAADNISLATSAFPYSATEGTLAVKVNRNGVTSLGVPYTFSDGTSAERIQVTATSGSTISLSVVDGGVTQADISQTPSNQMQHKAAWAANDFAACIDAGAVATDTSGTLPTVNSLRIGADRAATNQLNGYIQSILYVPRRVSNADLPTFGA